MAKADSAIACFVPDLRRRLGAATLLGSLLWLAGAALAAQPHRVRALAFTYEAKIGPIAADEGPVHVFVPLPLENEQQRVLSAQVDASIPGRIEREAVYGNGFWHGFVEKSDGEPIELTVRSLVERHALQSGLDGEVTSRSLSEAERVEFEHFLKPNRRVVVGHPVLEPILAEVRRAAQDAGPAARARAIYEWVVDHVEYKKVGRGWGNGDTFWACSERYGNCTDFHALFISLARSEGIPARFEMGFQIPEDRGQGEIGGYHCWVQFYLPGMGWIPIDASEAFKHPEKRDLFYGSQPTDRIHFTTGRDLVLGEDQRGEPLNYFIYPHVEVGGEPYDGPIEKAFHFQER